MFCYVSLLSPSACSFLMRDRSGVDPEGRGGGDVLGGVEGGEAVIRIYGMRESSVFNKKGKTAFNSLKSFKNILLFMR